MSKRFRVIRQKDFSGVSGVGHVADGVRFDDGTVVIRWRGKIASTEVFKCMFDFQEIHGHGGTTVAAWRDNDE